MSAPGSAAITAFRISSRCASARKCVTTVAPSSWIPCEPASNSAAITPSRLESGVTRSATQLTRCAPSLPRVPCWLCAQRFFELGPESLRPRRGHLLKVAKAAKEYRLLVGKALRRPELQSHVEVAHRARVDPRQAATAQIEDLSALGPSRYLKRYSAGDHLHVDVRAQRKLRVSDENLGVEIFAITLEALILFHLEHDEDVAARAATRTNVADAAHRHVLAGRDASRNPHQYLLLAAHSS